eukprot:scaffold242178_cov36-Tisochrysis_lutea.AAC.5
MERAPLSPPHADLADSRLADMDDLLMDTPLMPRRPLAERPTQPSKYARASARACRPSQQTNNATRQPSAMDHGPWMNVDALARAVTNTIHYFINL